VGNGQSLQLDASCAKLKTLFWIQNLLALNFDLLHNAKPTHKTKYLTIIRNVKSMPPLPLRFSQKKISNTENLKPTFAFYF
jgi:hypothetical protein